MSDNWLIYVPNDPQWVPAIQSVVVDAISLLNKAYPQAEEVSSELQDGVQFVDCGSDLESVTCPSCRIELKTWGDMMSAAYDEENGRFESLSAELPCCGAQLSLNDLIYDSRAAFAKFSLTVSNPDMAEDESVLPALESVFGTQLKTVLRHL